MTKVKMFFILLLGLALASCGANPKLDAEIQKNLPRICASAAQLHSSFVIIAAAGGVKATVVKKERAAFAATQVVCRDPSAVTSQTAMVTLAEAYAALITALKDVN